MVCCGVVCLCVFCVCVYVIVHVYDENLQFSFSCCADVVGCFDLYTKSDFYMCDASVLCVFFFKKKKGFCLVAAGSSGETSKHVEVNEVTAVGSGQKEERKRATTAGRSGLIAGRRASTAGERADLQLVRSRELIRNW